MWKPRLGGLPVPIDQGMDGLDGSGAARDHAQLILQATQIKLGDNRISSLADEEAA